MCTFPLARVTLDRGRRGDDCRRRHRHGRPAAADAGPGAGASVTPAFEGWYPNEDGSFSLLVGYYNRNSTETFDIPVGPNNRIEPGDIDQGQPTHFETGRQWGVFVIKVPKDFGTKTITWTLVANGEPQSIPLTLNPGYPVAPSKEIGMGNQPPSLAFSEGRRRRCWDRRRSSPRR